MFSKTKIEFKFWLKFMLGMGTFLYLYRFTFSLDDLWYSSLVLVLIDLFILYLSIYFMETTIIPEFLYKNKNLQFIIGSLLTIIAGATGIQSIGMIWFDFIHSLSKTAIETYQTIYYQIFNSYLVVLIGLLISTSYLILKNNISMRDGAVIREETADLIIKEASDYIFVKSDKRFEKIELKDIDFVEAANNFVILHTNKKRVISYITFKKMEEYLLKFNFIKVHKSFLVSVSKIDHLDSEEIVIGTCIIPIGRQYKDQALNQILQNRLLKR